MSTNIERAARAIAESDCRELAQPDDIIPYLAQRNLTRAQHLAAKGLLMPDLPEKEQDARWKVSCKHLPISHTSTAGNQVTLRTSYGWWHTDCDEARSLGLCLLAAADYAERNQE